MPHATEETPTTAERITADMVEAVLHAWHAQTGTTSRALAAWANNPTAANAARLRLSQQQERDAHEHYADAYTALHAQVNAGTARANPPGRPAIYSGGPARG